MFVHSYARNLKELNMYYFDVWKMEEVHFTGFICKLLETKIMQVLRFKHGQVYRTNKRDAQSGLCDVMLQSLLHCMACSGFSLYVHVSLVQCHRCCFNFLFAVLFVSKSSFCSSPILCFHL